MRPLVSFNQSFNHCDLQTTQRLLLPPLCRRHRSTRYEHAHLPFLPYSQPYTGGYCKEYAKGKRPVGVMLEDTWLLKITLPSLTPAASNTPTNNSNSTTQNKSGTPALSKLVVKWERRKRPSDAFAPSIRSGCTMALWSAKSMGLLFGGVTDEDTNEETLESVFHNDLCVFDSFKNRLLSFNLTFCGR